MQLRYLNFHKLLANFSGNLVGAFVALIVFQSTNSLMYTFLYLIYENIIRVVANFSMRKLYFKKPQIMLLFRVGTILLYNLFVLWIDKNLLVFLLLIGLFKGLDNSLNALPNEAIYNYSSLNSDSGSLGFTRLVEKIGVVLASLIGGFLLDINKTIVVCVALGIYFVSLLPLLIFYFKSRKSTLFNVDAVSNAVEKMFVSKAEREQEKVFTKELLVRYAIVYFLFAFIDITPTIFKFYLFETGGNYSIVGIFTAIYQASYGIGSFAFGYIDNKRDTTKLVAIASLLLAVFNICLILFKSQILLGVSFFFIGILMPMMSVYCLQRFLTKSRILGVSNYALMYRENSSVYAYIFLYGIGAIFNILLSVFIVISIGMAISGCVIPYNEEKTRKILVDVLQDNEIKAVKKRRNFELFRKSQVGTENEKILKDEPDFDGTNGDKTENKINVENSAKENKTNTENSLKKNESNAKNTVKENKNKNENKATLELKKSSNKSKSQTKKSTK